MFQDLWGDVKSAARSLVRRPLVTSVAIFSLALGIGVNTAIFSVFDRLLLRKLPVPAADEIVLVTSPGPKPGGRSTGNAGDQNHIFSYPLFRDIERLEADGLSLIAAHRDFSANLSHGDRSVRAEGEWVSGGYFPALGVRPALGRLLTPDDDRRGDGRPVVVLAHTYWTTQFGADPGVVGDSLTVNGEPMAIVGVVAEGFTGTTVMDRPQVFVPLAMAERTRPGTLDRRNHWLYAFARLQPGVARARTEAALNGPFAAIIRDELPLHRGDMTERAREQFLARRIVLEDGARQRMRDRGEAGTILTLLFAVTGLGVCAAETR